MKAAVDKFKIHQGDCIASMRAMPDSSVDSIVTDPPYELGFMGKSWDASGIAYSVEMWRQALRVLKPGGHLLAFSGSRTYHRMTCAIEDAGFEIRDQIMWVYGSGFPKSLDVSKAIDKHGGQSVAWFGPWLRAWREENNVLQKDVSALFPSKSGGLTGCVANWELGLNMPTPDQFNTIRERFALPFESLEVLAREVIGTRVSQGGMTQGGNEFGQALSSRGKEIDITAPATDAARQWQGWGTALKPAHEPICVARKPLIGTVAANVLAHGTGAINVDGCRIGEGAGRWPANMIHDGSDEVLAAFPGEAEGSAARFFYCAKASKADRNSGGIVSSHPTVKPTDLMRYLCRLVTPPGGLVLDPFTGSGSTGKAAVLEGFRFIGCELQPEYVAIANARIAGALVFYTEAAPAIDQYDLFGSKVPVSQEGQTSVFN